MKYAKFIFIVCVLALLYACSGDNPVYPDDDSLVGRWNWYLSVGGNLGTQTPENCQCEYWYLFNRDGTFEYHFDDEIIQSGEYQVTREFSVFFDREINYLYLDEIKTPFDYTGETMIFYNERICLSCPDSIYFRRDAQMHTESNYSYCRAESP